MVLQNIARGDSVRIKAEGTGPIAPTQTNRALLGKVLNINVSAGVTTLLIRWRGGPGNAVTNDGRGEETTEQSYNVDNVSFRVLGNKAMRGPTPEASSDSSSSSVSSSNSSVSSSNSSSSSVSSSNSSNSSNSSVSSSHSSVSSSNSSESSS